MANKLSKRPRPNNKKTLIAKDKAVKAIELRKQGYTLAEIAPMVGYKTAGGVSGAIAKEIDRFVQEPTEQLIKMELQRLDRMMRAIWSEAVDDKDKGAIETVLKIMDRRSKLLGLDKAIATSVSQNVIQIHIEGMTAEDVSAVGKACIDPMRAELESM
jgi:hypothetical protein